MGQFPPGQNSTRKPLHCTGFRAFWEEARLAPHGMSAGHRRLIGSCGTQSSAVSCQPPLTSLILVGPLIVLLHRRLPIGAIAFTALTVLAVTVQDSTRPWAVVAAVVAELTYARAADAAICVQSLIVATAVPLAVSSAKLLTSQFDSARGGQRDS
jgi:hypothetical protein